MGYKLINHAGCWKKTRRICKPRAAGECYEFFECSTSQVYQPLNPSNLFACERLA